MSWNYRVIRDADGLRIFDVYYNEVGEPVGTSASPTHVYGESVEDLAVQLALMREALERPILDEAQIGKSGKADA